MTFAADGQLLNRICQIAREAGAAIMTIYEQEFTVELKDDRSPLTEADKAAHKIIQQGLEQLNPRFPVLSEESASHELEDRLQWKTYWLVDPLDGTKEFIKKNGEFTVNIALVNEHVPVMGVVYAPVLHRLYCGIKSAGAWLEEADAPRREISVTKNASIPVRVVGSRSHASPALTDYLDGIGDHQLLSMGSSLKICLVAAGEADIYPRLGPTSEWDTAAAQAILESAGGRMINPSGRELRYNMKDHLLNPYFLAFGDSRRNWLSGFEDTSESKS